MSRKKNRNRGKPQAPQPKATPVQPSIDPKKTDIEMAHDEALATATDEDISAIGSEPKPHGADHDTLWEMVREARDIFRSAARRAEEASGEAEGVRKHQEDRAEELDARESAITDRDVQVSAREEALDARVLELAGTAETLDKRESTVADRELAFTDREAEIRKREINAEAGFVVERKAMLAALDDSVEDLVPVAVILRPQRLDGLRSPPQPSDQIGVESAEQQLRDDDRIPVDAHLAGGHRRLNVCDQRLPLPRVPRVVV